MPNRVDLKTLTPHAVALVVAEARGCSPKRDSEHGLFYCPCLNSPHGTPEVWNGRFKVFPARLHQFPLDMVEGFLRGLDMVVLSVEEGIPICQVVMDAKGEMKVVVAIPAHMKNLDFAFRVRGALKTLDDDFKDVVRSYKKKPEKSDIDELLDEAAGEGLEPEEGEDW